MRANKNAIFLAGFLGVAFFVASAILGALQFPEYSHISQFISESYATGTPYGKIIRYLGYTPSGILLFIFSISAIHFFPKTPFLKIGFWGLGIFYGLSLILTSIFPCDPGCNREMLNPSIPQIIHNLVGFSAYIFTPFFLLLIGFGLKKINRGKKLAQLAFLSGFMSLLFSLILFSNIFSNYIGLYQRIIETFILFWILACAFYIKTEK